MCRVCALTTRVSLALQGGGDPIDGPTKAEGSKEDQLAALGSFIKLNVGLSVFIGKGQIGALDDVAEALVAGKSTVAEATTAAEAILADKEVVADDDDKSNAEYYLKTIVRVGEKGAEYPKTELARLKSMVGGKLSDKKKELFQTRINILSSFQTA